jgi:hypothetical protein
VKERWKAYVSNIEYSLELILTIPLSFFSPLIMDEKSPDPLYHKTDELQELEFSYFVSF